MRWDESGVNWRETEGKDSCKRKKKLLGKPRASDNKRLYVRTQFAYYTLYIWKKIVQYFFYIFEQVLARKRKVLMTQRWRLCHTTAAELNIYIWKLQWVEELAEAVNGITVSRGRVSWGQREWKMENEIKSEGKARVAMGATRPGSRGAPVLPRRLERALAFPFKQLFFHISFLDKY